jgi:hypothetical protein
MKFLVLTVVASVVVIFGFNQLTIGNDADTSEEVEIVEEATEEAPVEAEAVVEEAAVESEETESPANEVEAAEAEEPTPAVEEEKPLTDEEKAIQRLKEYLEIENDDEIHIEIDHEENGKYYIQVFDIEIVNGVGHTVTRGWYIVDKETGHVESIL